MLNSYIDPAALLHSVIVDIEKQYNCFTDKKIGIVQNIFALCLTVKRIRRHQNPNATKTIGFFGGQKRGKSSLINHLIGCDLMPVSAIPMSSVVIRTKQDSSIADLHYIVDITQIDGYHDVQTVSFSTRYFEGENVFVQSQL